MNFGSWEIIRVHVSDGNQQIIKECVFFSGVFVHPLVYLYLLHFLIGKYVSKDDLQNIRACSPFALATPRLANREGTMKDGQQGGKDMSNMVDSSIPQMDGNGSWWTIIAVHPRDIVAWHGLPILQCSAEPLTRQPGGNYEGRPARKRRQMTPWTKIYQRWQTIIIRKLSRYALHLMWDP